MQIGLQMQVPIETRLNLEQIKTLADYDNEQLIQLMFTIKRHAGTMSYYAVGEYYLIYFTTESWQAAQQELPAITTHLQVQL